MALSDCEKCWDTPCTCGWGYRNYSPERLSEFISNMVRYKSKEEAINIIAHAKNLAEAGTVCNECGKTPRELLEERDMLKKLLMDANFILTGLKVQLGDCGPTLNKKMTEFKETLKKISG
jgi:hypothetical protein